MRSTNRMLEKAAKLSYKAEPGETKIGMARQVVELPAFHGNAGMRQSLDGNQVGSHRGLPWSGAARGVVTYLAGVDVLLNMCNGMGKDKGRKAEAGGWRWRWRNVRTMTTRTWYESETEEFPSIRARTRIPSIS